jgi:hypothetical protein
MFEFYSTLEEVDFLILVHFFEIHVSQKKSIHCFQIGSTVFSIYYIYYL